MKKKVLAMLLAAVMAGVLFTGCGGSGDDAKGDSGNDTKQEEQQGGSAEVIDVEAETGLTAEYDPNSDYDEWTLVEYTIEDAGATFIATVSKMSDGSKYEVHCTFFGDEQVSVLEGEEVTEDKTGFMKTDTPLIVEAAETQGIWSAIE